MTRNRWLVFAALCLVWGSTWIAADALAGIPPLLASAVRYLLSAAGCIPFLLLRRSEPPARLRSRLPSARDLEQMLLLSVTMIVLPLLLLLRARPQLPSATVVVLYAAMPLVVILLTPVLGQSDVPPAAMRASIVGLGGLVWAMGATWGAAQAGAAAVVLLAVASTGASSLLARRAFLNHNPIVVAVWMLGIAGFLLGLASLVWERGQPAAWDRHALLALILLAVAGGVPAYATWFWLLQRLQAYQVATVQWMEPLVALGESLLVLRIGLPASSFLSFFSWSRFAGSLVTLVSLLVVMRARHEDDENVSLSGI